MSLTFKRVDEIFKEYGLNSHIESGERTDYGIERVERWAYEGR